MSTQSHNLITRLRNALPEGPLGEPLRRECDAYLATPEHFPLLLQNRKQPLSIPYSMAERAYAAYRKVTGSTQTLQHIAERGGFSTGELDNFLGPQWREEASEIFQLRAALQAARTLAIEIINRTETA